MEPTTFVETMYPDAFAVSLTDPAHPYGFALDLEEQTLDIWWGGYQYWIGFNRIDTPEKVLHWLWHLGRKGGWDCMTPRRIAYLIEKLSEHFQWQVLDSCRGT